MTLLDGPQPGATEVTVWTLEMSSRGQFAPAPNPSVDLELRRITANQADWSRDMYRAVGADWNWVDRAGWSDADWQAWTSRPDYLLCVGAVNGEVAGYFELDRQGSSVEIAHFGLLPGFVGQGVGGALLSQAIAAGWSMPGVQRLWVHTCSLDSPAALSNYQRRGFALVGTATEWRAL